MKKVFCINLFIVMSLCVQAQHVKDKKYKENPSSRIELELAKTINPLSGILPRGIATREKYFVNQIPTYEKFLTDLTSGQKQSRSSAESSKSLLGASALNWKHNGPNVGGRTRSIVIDRQNESRLLAGDDNGGLWESEDDGQSWHRVSIPGDPKNISCIAQDPREGFQHIWYLGTGHYRSAQLSEFWRGSNFPYPGVGIYKSEDGGRTWFLLESTRSNDPNIADNFFDYCNKIMISESTGHILVAHFRGISKSEDGGATWELVLGDAEGFGYTNVQVNPDQSFFASIINNRTRDANGIYWSSDGSDWIKLDIQLPQGFRIAAFATTSNHETYILSSTGFAFGARVGLTKISWEKELNEGVTSINLLQERDLSANIPYDQDIIENVINGIETFGGYTFLVKVHPDHPDYVFVGGSSLILSTDGFSTPNQTYDIGGYSNDGYEEVYPNHYADQHDLVFYPSNANRILSIHDGGISRIEHFENANLEDALHPVDWESLNNGYFSVDLYAVALPLNSNNIIVNCQDRGQLFSTDLENKNWKEASFDESGVSYITADGRTAFLGQYYGEIARVHFDENENPSPKEIILSANSLVYPSPFVVDRNDENIIYAAVNNQITVSRNALENDVLWESPEGLSVESNQFMRRNITALAISSIPENILYVGTNLGLYKAENTASPDARLERIGGENFPGGYISCVTVDPDDANKVLVTFSNYGIPSIFYSENGGVSWVDISGNFEENPDGSGYGPSARWIEVLKIPKSNIKYYILGSSSGVFITHTLEGGNTRWYRTGERVIGNAMVHMVKARPTDGLIAVATHGNGLFTTKINTSTSPLYIKNPVPDMEIYENQENVIIDLREVFGTTIPNRPIIKRVESQSNNQILRTRIENDKLIISPLLNQSGTTRVKISGGFFDGRKAYDAFTVKIRKNQASILFDQTDRITNNGIEASQSFQDDFEVPEGSEWNLEKLYLEGYYFEEPRMNSFHIQIFSKANNGSAGRLIADMEIDDFSEYSINDPDYYYITNLGAYQIDRSYLINLERNLNLSAGQYFIRIQADAENDWFCKTRLRKTDEVQSNSVLMQEQEPVLDGNRDLIFQLYGSAQSNISYPKPLLRATTNSVSDSSAGSVKLTWEIAESDGVVGEYVIERLEEGDFVRIANVPGTVLSYIDRSGLENRIRYQYRIKAVGALNDSEYSNIASLKLGKMPASVKAFRLEVNSSTSVSATWQQPIDKNHDGLLLERSLQEDKGFIQAVNLSFKSENYTDEGLQESTPYYYRMKSYNGLGVATTSVSAVITPLHEPRAFEANAAEGGIRLVWEDISRKEMGYKVYRSQDANSLNEVMGDDVLDDDLLVATLEVNSEGYLDASEDLQPSTRYYYRIVAYNALAKGYSEIIEVETPDQLVFNKVDTIEKEIQLQSKENMLLYPNPNQGKFLIDLRDGSFGNIELEIYTLKGLKVYADKHNLHDGMLELNLPYLSKGGYIMRLNRNGQLFEKRIIIQ